MGCGASAAAEPEPKTDTATAKTPEDAPAGGGAAAAKPADSSEASAEIIDEAAALAGFLADLDKVTVPQARAALLTDENAARRKEIEAMSDEQVRSEFKDQSMGLWAQMGDSKETWDEMLDDAHQVGTRTKRQTEQERTRLSPKTRAVVKRRLSISQGLTEDDALAGFLAEIEQLPADVARAGLLGGSFKGKDDEVNAMSDTEVAAAYKEQSLLMWNQMGSESEKWDDMLSDVESAAAVAKESISPETRATRTRRKSISEGLSEDQALAGFMAEIEAVSAEVARGGLVEGAWKGKEEQVAAMTDDEVRAEYKKQSLEIWNKLGSVDLNRTCSAIQADLDAPTGEPAAAEPAADAPGRE